MNLTIQINHIQRGQAGNYQPHVYESALAFESDNPRELPAEWRVKQLAQVLVHSFNESTPDGSMDSYYSPRLKRCEQVDSATNRSVWIVRVEEPYTD